MAEQTAYSRLLGQAQAGELYLADDSAAYHMFKACDARIADLEQLRAIARRVQSVGSFGDFNMSQDLQKKYLRQATGDKNSIDSVIEKDIESVQQLREVCSISFKRVTGQDIENANALDYQAEQV